MTDTEFVLLIDSIRDSSPEQLRATVRAIQGDPLRQRLLEEALAFYGLMSASHDLWSGSVDTDESETALRELIALRMLTPIDDSAPGWLQHCLGRVPDDRHRMNEDDARRLQEVAKGLRRLDQESPVQDGLLRHTGLSMDEIRAVLPASRPPGARIQVGPVPSERGGVREPSPGKRRMLRWAGVASFVLLLVAVPVLSSITRSPAVSWTMSDARLGSAEPGLAIRGPDGQSHADPVDAEGGVLLGWATLRDSRRTWLGLFPRFREEGILRAAAIFERAGAYAEAPAATRGEALYGVAVTSWLRGDTAHALAALSDPSIGYSGAANRAALLEQRLRRTR